MNAFDMVVHHFQNVGRINPMPPLSKEWSLLRRHEFGEPVIVFVLFHEPSWQHLELRYRLREIEAMRNDNNEIFAMLAKAVHEGIETIWSRWMAL